MMKVKNDHRSKFSSLREKPEKYQGFNGIRTRDLRETGAMLDQQLFPLNHSVSFDQSLGHIYLFI